MRYLQIREDDIVFYKYNDLLVYLKNTLWMYQTNLFTLYEILTNSFFSLWLRVLVRRPFDVALVGISITIRGMTGTWFDTTRLVPLATDHPTPVKRNHR